MFKIIVKNLNLFGYHGVLKEERKWGQNFLFNIAVDIKKDNFVNDDNIKSTLNYSKVIELIKEINSKNRFNLLETFSQVLATKILDTSPLVERVKVKIEKTSPPIKEDLQSVGVEFVMERDSDKVKENYGEGYDSANKESKSKSSIVYLSIGSNVGNREKNLRKAVDILSQNKDINILAISSIYETEPMYVKEQSFFYNIVLCAEVTEKISPFELLGFLKKIEYDMGREKATKRFGPRIIDIDILYYDDICIDSDFLTIPHPKLKERDFVLTPLSEVSPQFEIDGMNIKEFIRVSDFSEKVEKLRDW